MSSLFLVVNDVFSILSGLLRFYIPFAHLFSQPQVDSLLMSTDSHLVENSDEAIAGLWSSLLRNFLHICILSCNLYHNLYMAPLHSCHCDFHLGSQCLRLGRLFYLCDAAWKSLPLQPVQEKIRIFFR
jgi:hypothetical protein